MPAPADRAQDAPEAARALVGGHGESAVDRPCRVCGGPLRGRQQRVCSGRCRAAWSRDRKRHAEEERTRQLRALLTEALRLLG